MRELLQQALDVIKNNISMWKDLHSEQERIVISALEAELAKPEQEPANRYSVDPHGNGYAIYRGRNQFHHGFNIGHLTEVTPDTVTLIEDILNGQLAKSEEEPSWATVKHYCDRIAELEAQLAKHDVTLISEGNKQEPVNGYTKSQVHGYTSPFVSADNSLQAVDHGFDRTASHMAGEYADTSEQRTHKSDKSMCEVQRLGQELKV